MTWNPVPQSPLRGRLARHLGRLQQNLDAVGEQVREAVANAVGRTVAEAIGEAVYEALCPGAGSSRPLPHSSSYSGQASTPQRAWDEPGWRRAGDNSSWRDPYDYEDYDDPPYDDDPSTEETTSLRNEPGTRRWGRAMAAGVQAAAWWLRRHPGEVSLLAALGIGTVAGLAVLAGHASGIAGLMASALGLAYLLDLMRSASSLFRRDVTP